MINFIAVVIAIASVLAALGHLGYLAMLNNAANKRAGGSPIAEYVRSRWAIAGGTTAVSLLAWLLTAGGPSLDILSIILAVGSGTVATKALQSTQAKYRSGG
jgi:membrane protease YdiL (CAAX protease family)